MPWVSSANFQLPEAPGGVEVLLVCMQVALEALSAGINFGALEGLWELIYTSAPDVV